jgi:hypothetical protein
LKKRPAGTWIATARIAGRTITAEGETVRKARLAIDEVIQKFSPEHDPE